MKAPETWNGKVLYYDETFRSRPYPTEAEAQWKLDRIREFHNPERGWRELSATIERTEEGYVVVRHHALYR